MVVGLHALSIELSSSLAETRRFLARGQAAAAGLSLFAMSEHLSALDATFLELEQADESAHMHIGAIMVFDPRPNGGSPSREELCQHLVSRLADLPRARQRLSEPHTGGLSWPEWEDDPAFEIGRHVARAALPAPGGDEELAEWASGFFSVHLDRHRPLWEMTLVEGLANGRWALAAKTHHSMVDGVGSIDIDHLLLDVTADAPPGAPSSSVASAANGGHTSSSLDGQRPTSTAHPTASGPLASLAHAWAGLLPVDTILHATQMGVHGALHPREALRSAQSALALIVNPCPGHLPYELQRQGMDVHVVGDHRDAHALVQESGAGEAGGHNDAVAPSRRRRDPTSTGVDRRRRDHGAGARATPRSHDH